MAGQIKHESLLRKNRVKEKTRIKGNDFEKGTARHEIEVAKQP